MMKLLYSLFVGLLCAMPGAHAEDTDYTKGLAV